MSAKLSPEQLARVLVLTKKLAKVIGKESPLIVVNACYALVQLSHDLEFKQLQDYRGAAKGMKAVQP